MQGEGFEPPNPKGADLQSAVFDRFTNPARGHLDSVQAVCLDIYALAYAKLCRVLCAEHSKCCMEPSPGFEPGTPSLPWKCSTPELRWHLT